MTGIQKAQLLATSLFFAALLALLPSACSLFTPRNVHTAIDAAALACVFASTETDAPALAKACGIAQDLLPILRQLIGQREGARRAGVRWDADGDAGAPDVGP